jgi:hypothetical protein
MKIPKLPKLVSLVVVAFVAVGLIAPRQAEAVPMKPGQITFQGNSSITQSGNENTLTFNNPWLVVAASGIYIGAQGFNATLQPITWTGSGSSAMLVGGTINPQWNVHGPSPSIFWSFALQSLTSATLNNGNLNLFGEGFTNAHSPQVGFVSQFARIHITRGPAGGVAITQTPLQVPETGSAVCLLGIGLLSLVTMEGLRRKIAVVQNR